MKDERRCDICEMPIHGQAANLSSLTEPPRVLTVCETCAGAEYVTIRYDGMSLVVDRDDYLRADRERLHFACGQAASACADLGWELTAVKVRAESDVISEELDEEW